MYVCIQVLSELFNLLFRKVNDRIVILLYVTLIFLIR